MHTAQAMAPRLTTTTRVVNGARLYCEIRGAGTPVLLVSGATGDAGHFDRVADLLARTFTVVTYDRRGNSRSPRPDDWSTTTIAEQADDAAALLQALALAPAAVFGTSGGAIIGLELALRHPAVVKGGVLHEPPLGSVVASPSGRAALAAMTAAIERGIASGGSLDAVEAFVRAATGSVWDRIPIGVRSRMLGNGETLFLREMPAFLGYRAEAAPLASLSVPVQVAAGTEADPFSEEATRWLADRLGTTVARIPGGHAPYFDRPQDMARVLEPLLREMA